MGTLDKGMLPVLGGTQQDGVRFHHATQNGTEFRTYELLIPGIFHLTFLARLWVIETTDEGALLC